MEDQIERIGRVISFWNWVEEHRGEVIPQAILRREQILSDLVIDED